MIENVDINALFQEYNISVKEKGENVTRGWVNIEVCPFCMDSNFHCGINLASGGFHCWVCGEKGGLWKLLREMEDFKGQHISSIIAKFVLDHGNTPINNYNATTDKLDGKKPIKFSWPEHILEDLPKPHKDYLLSRHFDPDFLAKKYNLKAVYNIGKHKFRIIVPVIINKKKVSWVAAWVLRKQFSDVTPYLNCIPEESVMPINHCLYNYDSIKDVAVIVEGITDVWRCGAGFVASFRKGLTSEQIKLLMEKKPKKVFVFYDSDATRESYKFANEISGLFPAVEVLELPTGDPGDLTQQEVYDLRRDIF